MNWTARVIGAAAHACLLLLASPGHGESLKDCTARRLGNAPGDNNGGTYFTCPVDLARFHAARCNDGSTAAFQLQFSPSSTSTKWVIWLEGGYACYNAATCSARAAANPKLVSASGWVAGKGQALLSHDPSFNPALADANTVLVHYCSSDGWSGGRRARPDSTFDPNDLTTWNFEGRAIAQAVAGTLSETKSGFGLDQATQVVLGGSSAGANGITYVANDLLPLLPAQAQVLLVQDAGFTVDVGRYNAKLPPPYEAQSGTTPNDMELGKGRGLWHGHGDTTCDSKATTTSEHLACYDTSVLLQQGYITLPTFVAETQLDTPEVQFQLCPGRNGSCPVPVHTNSPEGVYTAHYASQAANLLSMNGAARLPYTAYSPDIYVHTMLNLDGPFATQLLQPQNLSPRDSFNAWYANPQAAGSATLGTQPGIQKPVHYTAP